MTGARKSTPLTMKTHPRSDPVDDQAGQGGSEETRNVEGGGVESHRVGQGVGGYEPRHEGLPCRESRAATAPPASEHVDVPQFGGAGQHQDPQDQPEQAGQALGHQQEPASVDAVREDPGPGHRIRRGRNCRAVTTPTWNPSWEVRTVSTTQSCATRCIQVPVDAMTLPVNQSLKLW